MTDTEIIEGINAQNYGFYDAIAKRPIFKTQ
jgi:hypothetical protein